MKKSVLILLALGVLLVPSCKNQNNKKAQQKEQTEEMTKAEQMISEELKINMAELARSLNALKPAPFITLGEDSFGLTDKEKLVKPEYLLPVGKAGNFVTLSQNYRALGIYSVDKFVADMYDMSTEDYDRIIKVIAASTGDPAVDKIGELTKSTSDFGAILNEYYDAEVEAGRIQYFWELSAASLVEQIYIVTKNIDKCMPMFDDQSASDITERFIYVHDGITKLIPYHPEMEDLNKILDPLYVINAINVEQLRSQLTELKGEIEVVRNLLVD